MREFADLDTPIFDPDFTQYPYPYLADIYQRDEASGFSFQGMQFFSSLLTAAQ